MKERFRNKGDLAMLNRLEYGKILIDAVTADIGKLTPGYSIKDLKASLDETVKASLEKLVD